MTLALCADSSTPDAWFSDDPAEQEFAKRVCRQCPTRVSCLADAIARDEQWGIWAGVGMESRAAEQLTAEMAEGFLRAEVRGDVHGSRGRYNAGCHCDDCTAANTAYMAKYERPAPVTGPPRMDCEQLEIGVSA